MTSKRSIGLAILASIGIAAIVLAAVFNREIADARGEGQGALVTGGARSSSPDGIEAPQTDGMSRVQLEMPEPAEQFDKSGVSTLSDATEKLASAKVYEQDSRTLDQKYEGASLGQLMAAKCLLEERQSTERDRIAKELIAAGRLTEVIPNADGAAVMMKGAKDGSPVSTVSSWELVDGVNVVKAAVINGEEFPDYRALELEVWWLENKIHKLKKAHDSGDVILK